MTALAEDISQDVFIGIYARCSSVQSEKGTVAGYLYGITRYKVLRRIQRERSMVSMSDRDSKEI
ncbi:MAG: hypothetical protein IPM55_23965 [Acidobacteria bacterium]|nr:hypothetical protein [Acidobacteriota bacterium]